MNPAGQLRVRVAWDGARVRSARPDFQRAAATRLLLGRSPADALAWVPRLWSLCGQAQAAAARAALAAAGAEQAPPRRERERLLLEATQEHLWRLLRDWPSLLRAPDRSHQLPAWHRRLGRALRDQPAGDGLDGLVRFVELEVAGPGFTELASWADLERWCHAGAGPAADLLRPLLDEPDGAAGRAGALIAGPALTGGEGAWGDPDRPLWRGEAPETGAWSRQARHPLLASAPTERRGGLAARLVARLLDLLGTAWALEAPGQFGRARALEAPGQGDQPPAPARSRTAGEGIGIAWVETARGLLMHRVRLEAGRVAEYAVVAPTAWNFHPRGAFAEVAGALQAGSEPALRQRLSRWVLAFDPCVPWCLEIGQVE